MRELTIYFDFACPFCYNEWSFMKEIRKMADIKEDYYSWEIHPDTPKEGMVNTYLTPEKEEAVNRLGEPVGIKAGRSKRTFNTKKALQILEEAKKQGLQFEYMDAVFRAYFEEVRNIAEDAVILDIANTVGVVGAADVLAEGRYLDTILEHDAHCMDIELEFVPTIYENGQKVMDGILTFDQVKEEFVGK